MTGFYGDLGWLHQTRIKSPGQGFWSVLEGVDSLGQCTNRQFVGETGVDGVGGRDTNGVGCWFNGGVVYRGGFQIKM